MTLHFIFAISVIKCVAGLAIQNDGPSDSLNDTQTTKLTTSEETATYFLSQLQAMKEEQRQHSIALTNMLTRIITSSFDELKNELKSEIAISQGKIKEAISELKATQKGVKGDIKKDVMKARKKLNSVQDFLTLEITQMFQDMERRSEGLRYVLKGMEESQKTMAEDVKETKESISNSSDSSEKNNIGLGIKENLRSIDERLNQSVSLLKNMGETSLTQLNASVDGASSTSDAIRSAFIDASEEAMSNLSKKFLEESTAIRGQLNKTSVGACQAFNVTGMKDEIMGALKSEIAPMIEGVAKQLLANGSFTMENHNRQLEQTLEDITREFAHGIKSVALSYGENGTEDRTFSDTLCNNTYEENAAEDTRTGDFPNWDWAADTSGQLDHLILQASGSGQTVPSRLLPNDVEQDWILLQYRRRYELQETAIDASSYIFAYNTWQQYASGFGDSTLKAMDSKDDAAYWLGLNTMSQLTRFGEWELLIMRKDESLANLSATTEPTVGDDILGDNWIWGIWRDFKVGPESDSFRLSIGEKVNQSESDQGEEIRLRCDHLRGLPFVTFDRMRRSEQAGGRNLSCDHESIGGWWRDLTTESCLPTCLSCVERNAQGFVSKTIPRETLMAMRRRIPRGMTRQATGVSQKPSRSSSPHQLGSAQNAVEEVSQKLDEFAEKVQTWIEKRKKAKEQFDEIEPKEETIDFDESEAMEMSTEEPRSTEEAATTNSSFIATTATPIAVSTPTPMTFDDVKFDSFDDEDYSSSEENGSGSSSGSSSRNKDTPFNVNNFWEWG